MTRGGPGSGGADPDAARPDDLALRVGRLLRHPAYRRERVVSPLLAEVWAEFARLRRPADA